MRSKKKIINVAFALAYRRLVDENLAHESTSKRSKRKPNGVEPSGGSV
jgi:hypothetical protein